MYKFYNVATITIRTLCFNTFPGSKMEKGAAVSFKLKGNSNLPIKDIQSKGSGTFTVSKCIKRSGKVQTYKTKFGENKELCECILHDGCTHILMTMWGKLLKQA